VQRERGETTIRIGGDSEGQLELFLPLRRGLVGTSVLTHANRGEDGFYMLVLAPAPSPDATVIPRDLTLVVDVSGSMSGEKMEQARAALHQALGGLRAADRFRLITFSSGVTRFRDGYSQATPAVIAAARAFVDDLTSGGGTNLEGAVREVLATPGGGAGRLGVAVFMTDGLPTVGEQSPERIAALASGRLGAVRFFTIGVGHDVNTYLLEQLAVEGRGSAEYVVPGADVELAVGGILRRVSHPALTGLRIVEAPVTLREGAPTALPDLFFGEELVVMGRYRGAGRGTLVVEGERLGRRERIDVVADFPASTRANAFIPPIWAARRIGDLTRTLRL
jgi:Ca-activated chloride channel family protein